MSRLSTSDVQNERNRDSSFRAVIMTLIKTSLLISVPRMKTLRKHLKLPATQHWTICSQVTRRTDTAVQTSTKLSTGIRRQCLFVCASFNKATSKLYSVEWHDGRSLINWDGSGRKETWHNLRTILELKWRVWGKPRLISAKTACAPTKIRNKHLPNTSVQRHSYINPLCSTHVIRK
jgi:hypothetical protein